MEYTDWLASSQNTLGNLAVAANSAPELRIVQPKLAASTTSMAICQADSQWIPLRAEAGGEVRWACESLPARVRRLRPSRSDSRRPARHHRSRHRDRSRGGNVD
jgi:hypothetical protein